MCKQILKSKHAVLDKMKNHRWKAGISGLCCMCLGGVCLLFCRNSEKLSQKYCLKEYRTGEVVLYERALVSLGFNGFQYSPLISRSILYDDNSDGRVDKIEDRNLPRIPIQGLSFEYNRWHPFNSCIRFPFKAEADETLFRARCTSARELRVFEKADVLLQNICSRTKHLVPVKTNEVLRQYGVSLDIL